MSNIAWPKPRIKPLKNLLLSRIRLAIDLDISQVREINLDDVRRKWAWMKSTLALSESFSVGGGVIVNVNHRPYFDVCYTKQNDVFQVTQTSWIQNESKRLVQEIGPSRHLEFDELMKEINRCLTEITLRDY